MSRRLPAVRPRQVPRALQQAGFFVHHTSGSHYILKHPAKTHLRVTLPYHNHDLKRRTLESVIEQAGLIHDAFIDLL